MTFLDQVAYALVVAAFGSWHPSLLLGSHAAKCPPGAQVPSVCTGVVLDKSLQNSFLLSKVNTALVS